MLVIVNLRFYKVVLNFVEVMEVFLVEDRGKDLCDFDLYCDSLLV